MVERADDPALGPEFARLGQQRKDGKPDNPGDDRIADPSGQGVAVISGADGVKTQREKQPQRQMPDRGQRAVTRPDGAKSAGFGGNTNGINF